MARSHSTDAHGRRGIQKRWSRTPAITIGATVGLRMGPFDDVWALVFRDLMGSATRVVGWALAVGLALAVAASTSAQDANDAAAPPCLEETLRWCPLVPVGLVEGCLEGYIDKVSPACRKRVLSINEDTTRLMNDCAGDVGRLCTEPQTYAGQRVSCLVKHRDELSEGCRKTFDALSQP